MQLNFDYAKLKHALISATAQAFAQFQEVAQTESPYVFGLYICREGTSITPTANTEVGLTWLSQEYARKYGKPRNLYQQSLRWSPWDWAYHTQGQAFYAEVEDLLESTWSEADCRYFLEAEKVFQVCREALAQLDRGAIFGTGRGREALLLNLFKSDQSQAQLLQEARYLNSPKACDRFATELHQGQTVFFQKSR
uniref:DUF4303 domain-containing protein n=1 Tax=Trichocoleus desertorum TaxID=1481672 RepID=UPI0025B2ECA1|nr:DUF4303 domain-containing protein [Trichocoleus desertorum]